MTACWVDGVAADTLPADDRGLLYGDGLFETLRCEAGAPRFLELHLRRLQAGCAVLDLPAPDPQVLRLELRRAAAGEGGCLLRLTLTRGSSATRGYAPPVPCRPRRILTRHPLPPDTGAAGIRACFSSVIVGLSPTLAGIKHLNRLENVLARARLAGTGCEEAILSTATGDLVGGTMSNLFAVIEGGLVTPPLQDAGVRGVMREVVMREAAASGIAVRERPLRRAELADASELFFTNVRIGLWPVAALEGWKGASPGPRVRALRQRIAALRD
jgi:4-amino-4-deoxychorismate lyase